jgi:molecular chaperone DnaK
MVRDAQEHAAEDKQRRDEVELRNQAEQLTYQAERTLTDLGDKVSAEDKAEVTRQVETLREALKGSDVAAVRSGMDALTGTLSRVATAAYQAASPMDGPGQPGPDGSDGTGGSGDAGDAGEGEPAGAGTRSGGASDETVEGEFKEV